jgi:4-alpha-glucanotransferase
MAIKDAHGGADLETWEEDIRDYMPAARLRWREKLSDEVGFYMYLQYEFLREWKALRAYAAEKGIRIIGDIPVYVSHDSSDFWANRDLFMLDERRRVRLIAGVPPDGFSANGQVWGNPLYDWKRHAADGFQWWLKRIGKCRELYDVIRIDHFRGFDEFFAIPANEDTAQNGHWEKGPGIALFDAIRAMYGDTPIIAEDLGYVTDSVRALVRDTGFPNMKVLEFAFDSRDSTGAAEYLPFRYGNNCVVYTGTHDNETVRGWITSILPEELQQVRDYMDVRTDDPDEIVDKLVKTAHASVADLSVIPLQDYLRLDNSARINHPSTQGSNWKWRMSPEDLSEELADRIRRQMALYGRG